MEIRFLSGSHRIFLRTAITSSIPSQRRIHRSTKFPLRRYIHRRRVRSPGDDETVLREIRFTESTSSNIPRLLPPRDTGDGTIENCLLDTTLGIFRNPSLS